ncbi:GNAT family N-acetyltransferase [Xylanibacter caecicola]|uniref:GNAT family N-acetyltransferase n=1 Tax=Xylanibacter caecicola TaxID=2736294 RepID=UPI0025829D0C|nr:GNAT family N-acetyltransferase [Xylanibacter caecicola]
METKGTIIETPRLILRPWRDTDADALYRLAKDPTIGQAAGWAPHSSAEESREIIRTVFSAPEIYAVVPKDTGKPAGCCGIVPGATDNADMKQGEAEIGYWMGVPYQGRGFTTEAVKALTDRCFDKLGLQAVWISHYDGNGKSGRVAEKCGFAFHHTAPGTSSANGDTSKVRYLVKRHDGTSIVRITDRSRWDELVVIWEAAVRDSHDFLSEDDIAFFRREIPEKYLPALDVYAMQGAGGRLLGFMSLSDGMTEMLFIDPRHKGKGYGRRLLDFAVMERGIRRVDVNEQNPAALAFYRSRGFEVTGRDATDPSGRPFPILHMELPGAGK